jgi:retron-type reverse transcriptase
MAENRTLITEAIENGTYQPQAARGVEIDKALGGMCMPGIPTIVDRTIQYIRIIAGFPDNPD